MPYLPRKSEAPSPSIWGQSMRDAELSQPQTSTVLGAFAEEATVGVGTGYADLQAIRAKKAGGKLITKEEFDAQNFDGVEWYEGITDESAAILKEFNDAAVKRSKIIADASTGQSVLGVATGFAVGVFEPKNLAVGIGVSAAAGPLGAAGFLGNTARRAYQMRKTATLGQKAMIGAGEGVVAGIAVEPSSRYSAKVLQQDYTMMDSLFNVATSAAFGAGLPVAAKKLSALSPIIKQKINKFRGRTMDVVTAEVDLATQQVVLGQRVDVSSIEAAEVGTKSPEIVKANWNTKEYSQNLAKDATQEDADASYDNIVNNETFKESSVNSGLVTVLKDYGNGVKMLQDNNGIYVAEQRTKTSKSGVESNDFYSVGILKHSEGAVDNFSVRKEFRNKGYGTDMLVAAKERGVDLGKAELRTEAYASLVNKIEGRKAEATPDERAKTLAKHNAEAADITNDTLIDYSLIDDMAERDAIMYAENAAEAETYYKNAEAEIRQMIEQDILNDADLAEYQNALAELEESQTIDALETLKMCLTRG